VSYRRGDGENSALLRAQTVELGTGDELVIIDPEGQQVSDVVAFAHPDSASICLQAVLLTMPHACG
jgi:uncharacterized protein YcgI (DUF1989 family)